MSAAGSERRGTKIRKGISPLRNLSAALLLAVSAAAPLAAGAAEKADFCSEEPEFCRAAFSRPQDPDPRFMVRYLAASYLACLALPDGDLPRTPVSGDWPELREDAALYFGRYAFISRSVSGDRADAMRFCGEGFERPLSTQACSLLYTAYRSYYAPVCPRLSALSDLPPADADFLCRTAHYPDLKSCSSLKSADSRWECSDSALLLGALTGKSSGLCGDSAVCRAFYASDRTPCSGILEKLVKLADSERSRPGSARGSAR